MAQVLIVPSHLTVGAVEVAAEQPGLLQRVSAIVEAAPLATHFLAALDM